MGTVPGATHPEQSSFLLRARDGDPEIVNVIVAVANGRRRCDGAQYLFYIFGGERCGIDLIPAQGLTGGRQQLDCANAVSANSFEQVEGIRRSKTESFANATADVRIVR
jgi:hypothetical protein